MAETMRMEVARAISSTLNPDEPPSIGVVADAAITTVLEFLAREAEKEPDVLEVGGDVGGFQNAYFNAGDVCASELRAMAKEAGE